MSPITPPNPELFYTFHPPPTAFFYIHHRKINLLISLAPKSELDLNITYAANTCSGRVNLKLVDTIKIDDKIRTCKQCRLPSLHRLCLHPTCSLTPLWLRKFWSICHICLKLSRFSAKICDWTEVGLDNIWDHASREAKPTTAFCKNFAECVQKVTYSVK